MLFFMLHIYLIKSKNKSELKIPVFNTCIYTNTLIYIVRLVSLINCSLLQTRMQSLQPEPAARYRNVMDALWQIVRTEGIWRPIRGLNVTAVGAGPAHALYFACYERLKKVLSDIIHPGANSHLANGTSFPAHQSY